MLKILIEMPIVKACSAKECGYNTDSSCHARAITVGNRVHPGCDTYLILSGSESHTKARQRQAGVGACKMPSCKHNEDFECNAEKIDIGQVMDKVNCLTYVQRAH